MKPHLDPSRCVIALDAMGGDHGPEVVVRAAQEFVRSRTSQILLVGEIAQLSPLIGSDYRQSITIVEAPDVVGMNESPSIVIRGKPRASLRVAFELVRLGRAHAVVSTGNSGAMMAAGIIELGTLRGIGRPAIASLVPRTGRDEPVVLIDSGANVDCSAHQLVQFAFMGSYYAKAILKGDVPRVALLSNGSEESKGNDVTRAAARLLASQTQVNYVGYVEGNEVMQNKADVVVADGLLGNVLLKAMEGTAHLVRESLLNGLSSNLRARIGLALVKPVLSSLFRGRFDPSSYGGAPLLGLQGLGIVCHGASSTRAVVSALTVAEQFVQEQLIGRLAEALESFEFEQT